MNPKKIIVSAAVLLCSWCFGAGTYAQQRLWGVSVNGELFSMNADGSDVISASAFGVEQFGTSVAGFSESHHQYPGIPTNLVFTTLNSHDWRGFENYGKVVRIEPTGLKQSNYFRNNKASHGITDGTDGAMYTALVGPTNKWNGFVLLGPSQTDGWAEALYKPNKDYSQEYYLTTDAGFIYGVSRGDANNNGFLYKIEVADIFYGYPSKFFAFNNASDGLRPTGRLSVGQGGALFGYTLKGGASNKGTFYKVNNDGSGFKKLFDLANNALTKTESDGKYQTLLEVIAEGYLPATDDEGNYLIHDATGIYRVAPGGYLVAKISSINATRIAFVSPRFQHHVKVANVPNGATGIATSVNLQVNNFTGSNGYQLQLSTSSDFSSGVTLLESDDNVFAVSGLSNGTTYYTRARAKSWPYYGEVISFTSTSGVADTTRRLYADYAANMFSLSTSGGDVIPFSYRYADHTFGMKQLNNGDKLVLGYEYVDGSNENRLYKLSSDGLQKLYPLEYYQDHMIRSTIAEGNDGWIYSAQFSIMGPQFLGFFRFKPDGSAWESVNVKNPNILSETALINTPEGVVGISAGRQANLGFIYKIRSDFSGMDILHQITDSNGEGARPDGNLVYSNGWLFGTCRIAGNGAAGTIFKIRPNGSDYTVIHHFSPTFGKHPVGLVLDSDGTLFGATQQGGKQGKGIIYKINQDGTGFHKIYEYWTNFSGTTNPGCHVEVDDHYVYSLTEGSSIFRINKDGGGYTILAPNGNGLDLLPNTPSNAHLEAPANLADHVHPNADFYVSEIAGARSYTIQYSRYPDFSNPTTVNSNTRGVTGINLLPGTTYFARVRTSLSPAYGPVTTFSTSSIVAMARLSSPADGAEEVGEFDMNDIDGSPYISMIVDPAVNADVYELQVSTDSTFQGSLSYVETNYDGNNVFESYGYFKNYGETVYARVRTNFSVEWGPVTKFKIIDLPPPPDNDEWGIYPNPSSNDFTLAECAGINAIYVRDELGVLFYKNEHLPESGPVQFGEDLPPGIYILSVVRDNRESIERLVKE